MFGARTVFFAVAGAACLLGGSTAAAAPADAPDPEEAAIEESHRGFPYYRQYCASCHGLQADGRGPVAPALRDRPTDLTQLAETYGSPLPKAALVQIIDGRDMARAHGSSDMPVWGERLEGETPPGPTKEAARRQTLLLIVEYLQAIQDPPETE